MPSLTDHLRDAETHDRLPFHSSCPICRQTRLSGTIPSGGLVPPRTQALLAASLLAVSATAPATTAFAAEQDQQQDGTAPVAQNGAPDPADSPDFDPGGDATDLPDTAPPLPQQQASADPGNDDTAPVDQAPATNPDDPVVDPGDGSDTGSAQPPPVPADGTPPPSTPAATPPPAPVGTTVDSPPTPAPATETPAASATPPVRAPRAATRAAHRTRTARPRHKRPTHPAGPTSQVAPTTAANTSPQAATPAPPTVTDVPIAATARGRVARPGDRTHTVLAGESLWAIATDLLGADATPASVAREVNRLWQLNEDQIATGDPDLLMVGTRLTLR
jgi:hypothetical protein